MHRPPLYKELFGPSVLLIAALITLHYSPSLQQLIAGQAAHTGCHQGSAQQLYQQHDPAEAHADHSHYNHQHHHHH